LQQVQANNERRQHWLSQLIVAQAEQEKKTKKHMEKTPDDGEIM